MEGGIPFAVGADVPALDDKQFWARLQAWRWTKGTKPWSKHTST